ncbi:MAG: hypothetical protein PUE98_10315 [Galactobacillus timonensis]|jgi:hypothetical protein|uniref:hypothetical protein n=1 Tax=Galactobacillus timonensis TaxID=2041840 RepID=UPI002409A909|nr:hypothetical protein [Galactobacillus timonensis]MDD5851520.1 hypothetical protein [Galactobacillus timonensis]MDD6369650.1 hypothetical protein [Galactobacillus timonensis]MDD6600831.1 hypothetical protein [Galactobacillus timonensis]MDD6680373.1 hypothetical protein [Galactobacillus timonensis]
MADIVILAVIGVLLVLALISVKKHGLEDCSGCSSYGSCTHNCSAIRKDLSRARRDIAKEGR